MFVWVVPLLEQVSATPGFWYVVIDVADAFFSRLT